MKSTIWATLLMAEMLLAAPHGYAAAIATWTGTISDRAADSSGDRIFLGSPVQFNDTAQHEISKQLFGNFGSASSDTGGQALFGHLSGFGTIAHDGGGFAFTNLNLQTQDNATTQLLPGFNLPSGSPVDLRFTFSLNGTYTRSVNDPSQCPVGSGCATATATFNGMQIAENDASINSGPISFVVHTSLGATVPITTQLVFGVGTCSPCTLRLDENALFFIDPLTPGVTYTTDSGHLYFSAAPSPAGVPEPGTLGLLGCGIAAIGLRTRYRRPPGRS